MTSPHQGTQAFTQGLINGGWRRIPASHSEAYRRHGDAFLTWSKGGVSVAISCTSKFYDMKKNCVMNGVGDGFEVSIEGLFVPSERRNQSKAKGALHEWVVLAQACGVTLYLEPVPQEAGIDLAGLMRLYRSSGFSGDAKVMIFAPWQLDI